MHAELLKQLGPQLYDANLDQDELASRVRQVLKDVIGAQERPLSSADRTQVTLEITDDILGYGPIEPFLRDPDVTEVMVNGPRQIYLERRGKLTLVDAHFNDEAHLRRTIDKIVSRIGRRVDESSPHGGRPSARRLPRQRGDPAACHRRLGTDHPQVLRRPAHGQRPGRTSARSASAPPTSSTPASEAGSTSSCPARTGSGKTTTLNVLSSFIPADERIVTIEDAAELQLKQEHVIRLESRPVQHRGQGRGRHPRPGEELPAHAPRPHHRR